MYRKVGRPSLLRSAGLGFFWGFSVFVLGVLLDRTLARFGINGIAAVIDDLLIGMVAGALVFAYELHRYNAMLRQMRIIADMNHHIRNALQPIVYSTYLAEQAQQVRMIEQGTERIQWALREILPGEFREAAASSQEPRNAA
jgi:hypothetical protein